MRRLTLILAAVGLLALLAAAGGRPAHAAARRSSAPPRAQLIDPVCQKALDPPARAVSITAVMRPLTGTKKMEMEAQLLGRTAAAGPFTPISAPLGSQLGSWIYPPNPTLGQRPGDIWKLQLPVANLNAPATYHYQVAFRWLGAGGKVLGNTTLNSANCRQTDLRPDLYVQSFTAQAVAGHPQKNNYVAVIGNDGGTAAKAFAVQFTDGATTITDQVAKLGPGEVKTLEIPGPVCVAGSAPTLTLDPAHVVDQTTTANDTATATCTPAATAPTTTAGLRSGRS